MCAAARFTRDAKRTPPMRATIKRAGASVCRQRPYWVTTTYGESRWLSTGL
ncbi:acyl-CoA desaturase, partial [Xanthomonas perforans]